MSSIDPPPVTYPISPTNGSLAPSTSRFSTGPLSSSSRQSRTMFQFGMGPSLVIGSRVSSTTTTNISTSTSHPRNFSL